MDQQQTEQAVWKLGRALKQFNSSFMHFNRGELHQHISGCKPGSIGVLFSVREAVKSNARELKVSEISKLMGVTSPTITQCIKDLEAGGLVERRIDLNDRRAVGIVLTEHGEQVASQIESIFSASFNGLVEYLGYEQSDQLAELLTKAIRFLSEKENGVRQSHWNGDEEA